MTTRTFLMYTLIIIAKGGRLLSQTILLDTTSTANENIKKHRSPSLLLEGITATQNRLDENHHILPILIAKQSSIQAGIGGEERVQYALCKHSFPMNYHFYYDLTLFATSKFQLDSFLLTPYYGLIFEVKNISGTLKFLDNPPQLIQTRDNGEIRGLDSPAAQVERYAELLEIWFKSRNIHLPIYRVVVLAYPKQIVEKTPAKTKILFPNLITHYIRSLPQDHIRLDSDTFSWLSAELVNNHIPHVPDPICEKYNFSKSAIRTGVICKLCGYIGMKKTIRSWYCPICESLDHLAHLPAIREWFLIMGRKMTNTDCREFLNVDMKTATRILTNNMNLISEGGKRNRYYMINFH